MDKRAVHIVNELLVEKTGLPLQEIENIEGFNDIDTEDPEYPYDYVEGC